MYCQTRRFTAGWSICVHIRLYFKCPLSSLTFKGPDTPSWHQITDTDGPRLLRRLASLRFGHVSHWNTPQRLQPTAKKHVRTYVRMFEFVIQKRQHPEDRLRDNREKKNRLRDINKQQIACAFHFHSTTHEAFPNLCRELELNEISDLPS